ncbi:hypothetical protein PA598K_01372 [Paenibacillus sp. 598K]|uniref:hypothetical protein n=1 Tax=Paenibacillus sp. 598K TaxID=1117987 RepID=UPI000FF93670|nr:hypothetical protein [Paenibacillus sp. 598K]GBF73087.1 hypothetical protein PA598K_01372 [Paenibacillus sp. 598K]
MQTYVIRLIHPEFGSCSAEVPAATEADAREDIERRFPDCDIIGCYVKPTKQ